MQQNRADEISQSQQVSSLRVLNIWRKKAMVDAFCTRYQHSPPERVRGLVIPLGFPQEQGFAFVP